MKRLHTLIVLLGLALGVLITGCSQSDSTSTPPAGGTTNPPASTPSTNK